MDEELVKQATGTLGIPAVVVVTEMFKRKLPQWPGWAWPLVALAISFAINLMVAVVLHTEVGVAVVGGLVTGFLAMTAYDKVDKEVGDPNKPPERIEPPKG